MTEQKRLGTLIVVAMEARNLSTRDVVGKGDPFVAFHLDGDSKRIRADKRGGQHPKWDEEVRFSVMKNTSKKLKFQVFNDDKREPVLIGDATIDLSEVLDKTEWDAWHEISFRNKYAGEVSLEMTFYYDEPPPQKHVHNQPVHSNSLPPQAPVPNSYLNSASHIAPPPVVNKPISAPSAYPPSNTYPTSPNAYPPPNSSSVYPPPSSTAPSNVYPPNSAPSNVYPPNSVPPNVYPPHNSPPQSQPPQFFGPNRTQSPSSQYSSPGNVYPPPLQSQGFPPAYPPISSPPISTPSYRPINAPTRHDSGNLAFPIPIPTPITGNSSYPQSGYPPSNYPPNNNPYPPPNNIYPPPAGGNIYPPPQNTFNQGYPPNPYPPSGHY
ncbi:hypothetical protein RhiirA5_312323 [Rhizophagus irregularis]|uniref:C2 domain-containing protein n=1 Tax=Rhizophagus irregularis TaxID=588596 RepID=A0A2N0PRA5_9GLOM|nr:hypothetical protein RhiirA5_312323 [Rhizophagus irregularis]